MTLGTTRRRVATIALLTTSLAAACAPTPQVVWPSMSPVASAAVEGPTAAAQRAWGAPSWSDEFSGSTLNPAWGVYDSPGHAGNGLRRPSQVSVADGVMTQTGTADTVSAGMMLQGNDARDGRWEVRARAEQDTASTGRAYHVVVALIPVGVPYNLGERDVDFLEGDIGEGVAAFFLHHPPNKQDYAIIPLDLTSWHTFAIEITQQHVTWFVDGRPVVTDRRQQAIPTTLLGLNIQLDANESTGMRAGRLQVDWARYYPLPGGNVEAPAAPAPSTGDYDPAS